MPEDVKTAVAAPPVETPAAEPATRIQYDSWDKDGNPTVSQSPDLPKKAESESAGPSTTETKSEPKGKSAAESEAAPKQEKKGVDKKTADERIDQLTAERNIEREERRKLEERLRTLESAPKPTSDKPAEAAKKSEPLKRPNVLTWSGTPEEFDKAMDAYEKQRDEIAIANYRQQQALEAAQKEIKAKMEDAEKRYPDATDRIRSSTKAIIDDPQIPQAIKAVLDDTDILPDLMYALSDPEKLGEFIQKARTQPVKALRELMVMEQLVREELNKSAQPQAPTTKEESPAEPKPRAPKPPSEVSGRGAPGEDPAVSAVRTGNFAAAEKEWNAARDRKFAKA